MRTCQRTRVLRQAVMVTLMMKALVSACTTYTSYNAQICLAQQDPRLRPYG